MEQTWDAEGYEGKAVYILVKLTLLPLVYKTSS